MVIFLIVIEIFIIIFTVTGYAWIKIQSNNIVYMFDDEKWITYKRINKMLFQVSITCIIGILNGILIGLILLTNH